MTEPVSGETSLCWRVPVKVPVVKLAGAIAFLAGGLLLSDGDPVRPALAVLAALGLAAWATRDLVAPVRLAADAYGVTVVAGFAGQRRLSWREIEKITLDQRSRRGLRSEILEIDTGESLHLFSRYDLDAPPDEVVAALRAAMQAACGQAAGDQAAGDSAHDRPDRGD